MFSSYRFRIREDGEWSRDFRLRRLLAEVEGSLRIFDGLYYLDAGGAGFGEGQRWRAFRKRLKRILSRHEMGLTYHLRSANKLPGQPAPTIKQHCGVRVTGKSPKPADVQGVPATRRWCGLVQTNWPHARFAGTIACKPDSSHPKGAAADHFPPGDAIEQGREMHEFAIDNAEELGTAYSIWWDEIWTAGPPWTNSSKGRHEYDGILHRHHHWNGRDERCGFWCTPGYGACG